MNQKQIAECLRENYSMAVMSVYEYDNYTRLTNGSAAMYVDVRNNSENLSLSGERYGEKIDKQCAPNSESLLDTLSRTI